MGNIGIIGENHTFDGYNSLHGLKEFKGTTIQVLDFCGHAVNCILKEIGFDNIKIELQEGKELAIHLVEEGREKYLIQAISNQEGREVYTHIDPKGIQVKHGEIDIDKLLREREKYLQQCEELLLGLKYLEKIQQ